MRRCRLSRADSAHRIGIQAERSLAILGGVGCASRHDHGPMRAENGDQAVWTIGGSGAEHEPYTDAARLFFIVDNGSSHRGQASVERMRQRDKRIILVHTPIHASWLNQVEIYFSIIQRKVLTPNDFATLEAVRVRWRYTRS